jgi:hypothetical protein
VNVVDPDLAQDVVRLDSARQAAEVGVEELDLLVEESQNLLEGGASPLIFPTISIWLNQFVGESSPGGVPAGSPRLARRS